MALKRLDVSHSAFTPEVMKQLCDTMNANTILEALTAEHCEIDLHQATTLAHYLPQMRGLKRLELDGNVFAWKPWFLRGGRACSFGSATLVDALKKNQTLLWLKMGQDGWEVVEGREEFCISRNC